jgi:hypothetical protein
MPARPTGSGSAARVDHESLAMSYTSTSALGLPKAQPSPPNT